MKIVSASESLKQHVLSFKASNLLMQVVRSQSEKEPQKQGCPQGLQNCSLHCLFQSLLKSLQQFIEAMHLESSANILKDGLH